jgi:ABC-type transporter Mla subunit MlaD
MSNLTQYTEYQARAVSQSIRASVGELSRLVDQENKVQALERAVSALNDHLRELNRDNDELAGWRDDLEAAIRRLVYAGPATFEHEFNVLRLLVAR